jgi:FkbM family methyltransferase
MGGNAQHAELHPPSIGARLVRTFRFLRNVRGWERVAAALAPQSRVASFVVANSSGLFAGDLSSFIDRRMYLFGEYEHDLIRDFISAIPEERRGTVLDIGANVGTHSLAFARYFNRVHAFEPNPQLWENFQRNIDLNGLDNVRLHKTGLGDEEAELPFYRIDNNNYGLGTFSNVEQYDLPLREVCRMRVAIGDAYAEVTQIGPVDAIKIDVQGFELKVLAGLARVLERDRPFVWLEVGPDTASTIKTLHSLRKRFPFRNGIYRFEQRRSGVRSSVRLAIAPEGSLVPSDYLIAPADVRQHGHLSAS